MARLPNAALARIREIEADLRLVVDGGPSALAAVTAELPSLVQSDGALSYVLAPSADTVRFQESFTERLPRAFLEALGDHMARQPVGWTMYNPLRPDPRQRNRVFYTDTILRLLGLPSTDSVPMYRDLFP